MFTYHRILNSETEKLIQGKDDNMKHVHHKISKLKYIVVPFLFCLFVSEYVISFVVNEWTQFSIQHGYFVNDTSNYNSSACENKNTTDPTYITYKEVQQRTSSWLMYYKIAEYTPTVLANLILPSYTNTFGRRYLFILGSFTMLIRCGIITFTIHYQKHLIYIVLAYIVQGCSGTGFSIYSTSFSYIADLTSPSENRVLGIVAIEAVLTFTSVVSGFLSGYLVETAGLGYFNAAIICTCLNFIALLLATFLLPESLPHEERMKRKSILSMIKQVTDFYHHKEFKGLRLCFLILLLSFAFAEITNVNRPSLETLFLLGQPFCWGPSKIGDFQLARNAVKGGIGMISLHFQQKLMSNEAIAIISSISNMASFIMEGYANTELKMYLVAILGVFSFLIIPMVRGLMSIITSSDKQGSMFASIAVIQVLSALLSALSQNSVYSATISIMNGFVFLVMAGSCVIDCILLIIYCFIKPYNTSYLKHKANHNDSIFNKNSAKS